MLQNRHQGRYTKGISPSTCVPTLVRIACPLLACNQKAHELSYPIDSRTGSLACWPSYRRRLYCLTNNLCIARLALSHTKVLCTCNHNPRLARSCHRRKWSAWHELYKAWNADDDVDKSLAMTEMSRKNKDTHGSQHTVGDSDSLLWCGRYCG